MGNENSAKQEQPNPNDRIVQVNDTHLLINDDHRPDRRNIVCSSEQWADYIKTHHLDLNDYYKTAKLVGNMLRQNQLTDLKIVKVDGFY